MGNLWWALPVAIAVAIIWWHRRRGHRASHDTVSRAGRHWDDPT